MTLYPIDDADLVPGTKLSRDFLATRRNAQVFPVGTPPRPHLVVLRNTWSTTGDVKTLAYSVHSYVPADDPDAPGMVGPRVARGKLHIPESVGLSTPMSYRYVAAHLTDLDRYPLPSRDYVRTMLNDLPHLTHHPILNAFCCAFISPGPYATRCDHGLLQDHFPPTPPVQGAA